MAALSRTRLCRTGLGRNYLHAVSNRNLVCARGIELETITQSEWMTVAEAANYLTVRPRTLLLWARQGRVKAFALSGTRRHVWRFRRQDLDAALLESSVLPSIAPSVRPAERTGK